MEIKVRLEDGAHMPERAYEWDAGADLRVMEEVLVPAYDSRIVNTGVHVDIPEGYVGMLKSKSGLNINHGIQTEGVIDAGFTGAIMVKVYNNSHVPYTFMDGDKITQLVIMPVETPTFVQAGKLKGGERKTNGYGSTGK